MRFRLLLLVLAVLMISITIITGVSATEVTLDSSNAVNSWSGAIGTLGFQAKDSFILNSFTFETNTVYSNPVVRGFYIEEDLVYTVPSANYAGDAEYTISDINIFVPQYSNVTFRTISGNMVLNYATSYKTNQYIQDSTYSGVNPLGLRYHSPNLVINSSDGFNETYTLKGVAFDNLTSSYVNSGLFSLYDENLTLLTSNSLSNGFYRFNMGSYGVGNYTLLFTSDDYFDMNKSFYYDNTNKTINFLTSQTPAISIKFFDETNKEEIVDVSYSLIFSDSAVENTKTATGRETIKLNDTGDLEIVYYKDGYSTRFYYLNISLNTASNLDLYLLDENTSSDISYLITDQAGVSLEGATLSVLRRYVVDDSPVFEVVSMAKSDNNGGGGVFLQLQDATYKFIVQYNNNIILTTNPSQIYKTSLIFKGVVGSAITSDLYDVVGLSQSLTTDGENFTSTYVDSSGVVDEMCLNIYIVRGEGRTLINSSCSTSSIASLEAALSGSSGSFQAVVVASVDGQDYLIDQYDVKLDGFVSAVGIQGVFWTAVYIIIAASLAFYSPIVALLLVVVGLIASSFLFLSVTVGTLMLVASIAGFLLYSFRRGGA